METLTNPKSPSSDEEAFRQVLQTAKNIVILAGAGLSAGSGEITQALSSKLKLTIISLGLKTYRDTDGLWKTYVSG